MPKGDGDSSHSRSLLVDFRWAGVAEKSDNLVQRQPVLPWHQRARQSNNQGHVAKFYLHEVARRLRVQSKLLGSFQLVRFEKGDGLVCGESITLLKSGHPQRAATCQ